MCLQFTPDDILPPVPANRGGVCVYALGMQVGQLHGKTIHSFFHW